jgi:hypothetical protein
MLGYHSPKEVFYEGWDGQMLQVDRIDNKSQTKSQNPTL